MARADEAPVLRIRGRYRYHVLLKVIDHPDARPLFNLMSELADTDDPQCQIYAEFNPATLL
jgi:primosomal protein N'